jgi:hypothetical protein
MADECSTAELFGCIRSAMAALKARGVIRTENIAGDYAEYLVGRALDGILAGNSQKSHDVVLRDGGRIQVKCRVVATPLLAGQRQLSAFRSFDFDSLVVVFLSDLDYGVVRAVKWPAGYVEANCRRKALDNSYVFTATEANIADPSAVDLTDALRSAV